MRRYRVACLVGDGVGPELMAEASRAVRAVSSLHGFAVEELHPPFGGEAVRRSGHPLPPETRSACRQADAVLIAATKDPALEAVKAELDLSWRVQRVRCEPGGDLTIVSPLAEEAEAFAVERAFEIARTRRARVTSVGASERWKSLVAAAAERHAGIEFEQLSLETALPLLAHTPDRFDLVVTEQVFSEALSNMAGFGSTREPAIRVTASGRLADDGRGIFGPTHGSALDIAGQGVANPSGILLAAALLLAEGLGERAAARTLEEAVTAALRTGVRTADMVTTGAAATTREFMDALLAELPVARPDMEFVGARP